MKTEKSIKENNMTLSKITNIKMLILSVAYLGISMQWGLMGVFVPRLLSDFTNSAFIIGLILSMVSIAGFTILPLASFLSDRLKSKSGRRKPFLLVGGIGSVIAISLIPNVPIFSLMIISTICFCIFLNIYQGLYMTLVLDITPTGQQGTTIGYINLMKGLGLLITYMGGGLLLQKYGGWETAKAVPFYLTSIGTVITLFITIAWIKETPISLPKNGNQSIKKRFSISKMIFFSIYCIFPIISLIPSIEKYLFKKEDRLLYRFFTAQYFWWFGLNALCTFFVLFTRYSLSIRESDASLILGVFAISNILFAIPVGILGDNFGKKEVLAVSLAFFALTMYCGYFVQSKFYLYLLMGIVGIWWTSIVIIPYAYIGELTPKGEEGKFIGLYNLFIHLPSTISDLTTGKLIDIFNNPPIDYSGYRVIFIITGVMILISLVLLQRVKKPCMKVRESLVSWKEIGTNTNSKTQRTTQKVEINSRCPEWH